VIRHNQTFSNRAVMREFHRANGLFGSVCHPTSVGSEELGKFDVIMSFAAWCFHIEPDVYLPRVDRAMKTNTKLILDVRRDKPEWTRQLMKAFGPPDRCLEEGKKHQRLAWT
jgi:hypothetical protein